MGGRPYTITELERIHKGIEMFSDANDTELARRLLDLGAVTNRSVNGLAQQIRIEKNKDEKKEEIKQIPEADDDQMYWDALMSFQYRNELDDLRNKYDSLMHLLIDESDVKEVTCGANIYRNLIFKYVELNKWIRENELLRLTEKIENYEYRGDKGEQ